MTALNELMPFVEDLRSLQLDQVQSVAHRDTDEDNYNYSHLITIRKTLERWNVVGIFDFASDIEFINDLLRDHANEVMNG